MFRLSTLLFVSYVVLIFIRSFHYFSWWSYPVYDYAIAHWPRSLLFLLDHLASVMKCWLHRLFRNSSCQLW